MNEKVSKRKRRPGRPPKDPALKYRIVCVKLHPRDFIDLREHCASSGRTVSEVFQQFVKTLEVAA